MTIRPGLGTKTRQGIVPLQSQHHTGKSPGQGNDQQRPGANKVHLPDDAPDFERRDEDEPQRLPQKQPDTPQRGQEREGCSAEVRQRDKDHIRTAVTFHPYGRSASCHGRPRVDSIHSGKQPMTYFP